MYSTCLQEGGSFTQHFCLLDATQLSRHLLSNNMCLSILEPKRSIGLTTRTSVPDFIFSLPPTGLRNHLSVASPGQIFRQNLLCPYKTGKCHCPHFKGTALRFFQDSLQSPPGTGEYKLLGNIFCWETANKP